MPTPQSPRSSRQLHSSPSYLDPDTSTFRGNYGGGNGTVVSSVCSERISHPFTVDESLEQRILDRIHSRFQRSVTLLFEHLGYGHAVSYARDLSKSDESLLAQWESYRRYPQDSGPTSEYFSLPQVSIDNRWDRSFFHDVFARQSKLIEAVRDYFVTSIGKKMDRSLFDKSIKELNTSYGQSLISYARLSSGELRRRLVSEGYRPCKGYERQGGGRRIRRRVPFNRVSF